MSRRLFLQCEVMMDNGEIDPSFVYDEETGCYVLCDAPEGPLDDRDDDYADDEWDLRFD